MPQLQAQYNKVRDLLSCSNEEELIIEYKLYAKYKMIDNKLMISSIAKPDILKFNKSYFDIDKMKSNNQLSKNSMEHIFPYGDTLVNDNVNKSVRFLVKTSLSEKCRVLMFSEHNDKSKSKFCIHQGPAGTGKTETFKD